MPWEVFRAKGRTALGHLPIVAVHKAGRFSMNQAAYDALGQPTHVELLFDEAASRMGLRAATSEDPHAYTLKQPAGTSRYYITATSFARHYGISPSKTYERDATPEGGVLAIDVDATPRAKPAGRPIPSEADDDSFGSDDEFAPTTASPPATAVAAAESQDIDPDDIPF
jgi:hypothetical protein